MAEPRPIGEALDRITPPGARTAPTQPQPEPEIVRLARRVKLMRDAQRKWFDGDKSSATFRLCRQLEGQVDKALAWVLKHRQGELFAAQDGEDDRPGAYGAAGGA